MKLLVFVAVLVLVLVAGCGLDPIDVARDKVEALGYSNVQYIGHPLIDFCNEGETYVFRVEDGSRVTVCGDVVRVIE